MESPAHLKWVEKVLFNERDLQRKIKELAVWVNKTYAGVNDLVIVGLLKGSIPFLAELIKHLEVPFILDFMTVSTYSGQVASSRSFKIVMDLKQDIAKKHVLIVEDIVDSGLTLSNVIQILNVHLPASVKVLTLLDKPTGRITDFKVDKYGFIAPDAFLVGFGLDYKEKLRGLPFIGVFDKAKMGEL